ncbi:hypothetical protein A9X01_18430 [Mycobacterium asiaticum]|uniref:Uncharacterized protein n=1 Tax=Mycobacterium asiaticum TaxID=1790 RepID=A0A1A3CDK1_MYCAS|nr:hypothetical protein A9X01_18430 [Mycobacterium asiaticum]
MMCVLKQFRTVYVVGLAYLSLLLAFAFLGGLVAALAAESALAIAAAVGLIVCLVVAVAGFRAGSRRLDQSHSVGDSANNTSIFATPLRRDEIDQYLKTYRRQRGSQRPRHGMAVVPVGSNSPEEKPRPNHAPLVAAARLSA